MNLFHADREPGLLASKSKGSDQRKIDSIAAPPFPSNEIGMKVIGCDKNVY